MSTKALRLPLFLIIAGALVIAFAFWYRVETRAVFLPIDLHQGKTTSAEFQAPSTGYYIIGLQMDQDVAKKLLPCHADPLIFPSCKDSGPFPVDLNISLLKDSVDISQTVSLSGLVGGGGQYEGQKTFTRLYGYVNLSSNQKYLLKVISRTEGSIISSANPRLIVEKDSRYLEAEMLKRLALAAIGLGVSLLGGSWLAFSAIRRHLPLKSI